MSSLSMSGPSTSSLNTISPLRCSMIGRMRCRRSCRHTSRFRFPLHLRGRDPSGGLRIYFRERPTRTRTVRVSHRNRRRGGVGDGGLLALFSIDSTRAVIFNVRLGGGGGGSVQPAQLNSGGAGACAAAAHCRPAADRRTDRRRKLRPPAARRPMRWHRQRRHATKSPPPIRPRSRARSPCPSRWRASRPRGRGGNAGGPVCGGRSGRS